MPASGKKTGRSTGARKNTKTTNNRNQKSGSASLDPKVQDEIFLIGVFAFCIFLFLCNLGVIGSFGKVLSDVQFGLFGLTAYIFPIVLFLGISFHVINRYNKAMVRKLLSGTALFFLAGMICEFIAGRVQKAETFNPLSYYVDAASAHNGGGFLAGMVSYFSNQYLSAVGSILLIIVLALICIVLITEKSLIDGVKEGSRYAEEAMEAAARRRQERKERYLEDAKLREEEDAYYEEEMAERRARKEEKRLAREEKRRAQEEARRERREQERLAKEEEENEKILRMDKKARGVAFNTTLKPQDQAPVDEEALNARDELHELSLEEPDIPRRTQADEEEIVPSKYRTHDREVPIKIHRERFPEEEVDTDPMPEKPVEYVPEPVVEPVTMPVTETPKKPETVKLLKPVKEPDGSLNLVSEKDGQMALNKKQPVGNPVSKYKFPPVEYLKKGKRSQGSQDQELRDTAENLENTLRTFGVDVKVTDISQGPAVTRYELQPEVGVKVSKIVNLADDIKLNLAATEIRIEAPIPGKSAVGIEVPNKNVDMVAFRDLVESKEFKESNARLSFAVGKDIGGRTVVTDLAKMPHLLIAGSTGSGKSVCINTIIMSILYKSKPDEVKMILIDPKVVELSVYNGVPHLLLPVVTDPKKAAASLQWGVKEMTDRYQKFAEYGVRDLKGYNAKVAEEAKNGVADAPKQMPQILIVVDELADLMMVAAGEVEEAICRLAQLARAAGIHLIIATQRPSVDVITGLIKANMPSRIAFAVSSGVDSRTILDTNGAEKLLGKGDMLFAPQSSPKPTRVQGAFVSDEEVQKVTDFLRAQNIINDFAPDIEASVNEAAANAAGTSSGSSGDDGGSRYDELFEQAGRFIIEKDKASIGLLQRAFKIGFNRAARIMDQLAEAGVVGPEEGTKPRRILMGPEQFDQYVEEYL